MKSNKSLASVPASAAASRPKRSTGALQTSIVDPSLSSKEVRLFRLIEIESTKRVLEGSALFAFSLEDGDDMPTATERHADQTRTAIENLSKGWSAGNKPQSLEELFPSSSIFTGAVGRHAFWRSDICLIVKESIGSAPRMQGLPEALTVFISLADRKPYCIVYGELYDCTSFVDSTEVEQALMGLTHGARELIPA